MINHLHGDPTATMLWEWHSFERISIEEPWCWKIMRFRNGILYVKGRQWKEVYHSIGKQRFWNTAADVRSLVIIWLNKLIVITIGLSFSLSSPVTCAKVFFQTHKLSFPLAFLERWVFDSNLHKSSSPLRLYGYAVSIRGAQKFIRLFDDPWLAIFNYDWYLYSYLYSTWTEVILNQTFNHQSFRILKTDIQIGKRSHWNGFLADSVMEIIYCVRVCVHMEERKEIVIWRVTHLSPDGLITRKAIL